MRKLVRILAETGGAVFLGYWVFLVGAFVMATFTTGVLLAWLAPFAAGAVAGAAARRWLPGRPGLRGLLDLWLASGLVALGITAALVELGWPLHGPHREGWAIGGPSENFLLLPWIHLGLFALSAPVLSRLRRRRGR